ncbi:MAG: acyl-CoA dehydrogenase, partial [Rhodospirillales bacterium]|nr:acyl-CoA dehydrogenase [Rhodospirillales bacterium]
LMLAFAYAEPQSRYNPSDVETRAEPRGDAYLLNGRKSVVFHAATADKLIVSARTAGEARDAAGIGLFLVDREAEGLTLRAYPTVDGLRAAELRLEDVRVDGGAAVGEAGGALPIIEQVLDRATIAVCAEAVGTMGVLLEATRAYLETRTQFGAPIGSFQVLQHRVVDMFMAYELSRALVYRAAAAAEDAADRAAAASAAKVQVGKAGRMIGQAAIQLHGGMGMTEEFAVGHHFKRLSMIGALFGDTDHHLRRFAALRRAS